MDINILMMDFFFLGAVHQGGSIVLQKSLNICLFNASYRLAPPPQNPGRFNLGDPLQSRGVVEESRFKPLQQNLTQALKGGASPPRPPLLDPLPLYIGDLFFRGGISRNTGRTAAARGGCTFVNSIPSFSALKNSPLI